MKTIALFSYYPTAEGAGKNVKEILIVSSAEGASEKKVDNNTLNKDK